MEQYNVIKARRIILVSHIGNIDGGFVEVLLCYGRCGYEAVVLQPSSKIELDHETMNDIYDKKLTRFISIKHYT